MGWIGLGKINISLVDFPEIIDTRDRRDASILRIHHLCHLCGILCVVLEKIFQFYLNVADCRDDEWRERDNPARTLQGYSACWLRSLV